MALPADEVEDFFGSHSGWDRVDDAITKTFPFADFNEAMGFVTRVALAAERADHHPDIDIRWNKVTTTLSTHSEGGITQKDLDMADKIEELV